MDRFVWADGTFFPGEQPIVQQSGIRLYDGEEKSRFDRGKGVLTPNRLLWTAEKDKKCIISLSLSHIVLVEEFGGSFNKSPKLILHLTAPPAYRPPGPVSNSKNSYIKLSFTDGGKTEFHQALNNVLEKKSWEQSSPSGPAASGAKKAIRTGIGGIEQHLQQKHKDTDKSISQAFQDLSKLMNKAEEMVKLSKNLSQKIKDKQGDITEDETVRFKSYLLSLGISDPVTRESHGGGDIYFRELAKQVASTMEQPLQDCGGILPLSDVYCRVNRARGIEMLSPEDLLNACKLMDIMNLPVRMQVFESGVKVLQLRSHSEAATIEDTLCRVESSGSLTGDELARLIGLSVVLARERLLAAEKIGKLCRDDTTEGLRFYPNLFLRKGVS